MVNIIGSTLFLIYTLVYYVFTVNKRAYVKQFALVLAILIGVIVYTNSLQDEPYAITGGDCSSQSRGKGNQ